MKKLFLFFNNYGESNATFDAINAIKCCKAECVFKPVNKIFRAIRRFHVHSGLPGIGFWLLDWKNHLDEIDICVCIASKYSPRILKYIKHKNKNIKCINYFWDPIPLSGYPVVDSKYFENWSFYINDTYEYVMKFNPQFFIHNAKLPETPTNYDIIYMGADRQGRYKGRTELIIKYYNLFNEMNIKSYIHYLTKSKEVPHEIRKDRHVTGKEAELVWAQGKAVLELVEPDVRWSTLRPLFALYNHKKLITNNPEIINEKFYSKENIFILGVDDISKLREFLDSDFVPVPDEIMRYYSVEQWCRRFEN